MRNYPSISERVIALTLNSIVAYFIYVAVTGKLVPDGGINSIWIACAVSYWFLSLLSAPWFLPPRDAVIAGVGATLVLVAMEFSSDLKFANELYVIRSWSITFSIVVVALAVVALLLHDRAQKSPLGIFAFKLTGIFGRGELLFSPPAIISVIAGYQDSFATMAWMLLYWVLIVVAKPVEKSLAAIRQLREDASTTTKLEIAGTISRIDYPNIVRVRLTSNRSWTPNRLYTVAMPDGTQDYVVSLFSQMQGSEVVGTGLSVAKAQENIRLETGSVCSSHSDEMTAEFLENLSGTSGAKLIGFVVENSNIGVLSFEVAANAELEEGDVVFARLSGKNVFYQIIGAETFEESFDQNPRGTHLVRATQLGVHSEDRGFTKYAWLPPMNTPLFSAREINFPETVMESRDMGLGKVPSTNVEVAANIDDLIEYHSAVLGVTGTGKTEVALDIVRAAVGADAKVFCVDFTGDYRARLDDLSPTFPSPDRKKAMAVEGHLATIDAYGFKAGDSKERVANILREMRTQTKEEIEAFLTSDKTNLAIFELAEISNSKAGLRITEIFLSSIMNWAKENRRAKKILICLEEAHTIVPESYGSGFDGETKWVVERIGQIALQGRKYGVGLLVITQRTALVSKTILSQCNTFLTHNLIDQTSLNFLESVYSAQHTRLIPNLGRFEFLAYGKAVRAERPILLRRDFDPAKLEASMAVRDFVAKEVAEENGVEKSKPNEEGAKNSGGALTKG